MNNIERKLLSVTLTNVNIDLLEDIINSTPNPSLAVEILCGLYVAPSVPHYIWRKDILCTLTGYNKWEDKVEFTYEQNKTVYEYFPKAIVKSSINKDNYKALTCSYDEKDAVRLSILLDDIEIKRDSMSLANWQQYHTEKPYVSEGKKREIAAQNMYADAADKMNKVMEADNVYNIEKL